MQRHPFLIVLTTSLLTALATSAGTLLVWKHTDAPVASDDADVYFEAPVPFASPSQKEAREVRIPPEDLALMTRVAHGEDPWDEPTHLIPRSDVLPVSFEAPLESKEVAAAAESTTPAHLEEAIKPAVPQDAEGAASLESVMSQVRAAQGVILNNITNANTVGFKKSRMLFEDLAPRNQTLPGMLDTKGRPTPMGIAQGGGMRIIGRQFDFSQGTLRSTGRPLDLAIEGDGFFQVNDGERYLYTRLGALAINANGELVFASADRGRPLEPAISIPIDTTQISINREGLVYVEQPGQQNLNQVGQIQMARFINPQGLIAVGENLYVNSDASGFAQISTPGQDGLGVLRQNFLEDSNVDLQVELGELRKLQQQLDALQKVGEIMSGRP